MLMLIVGLMGIVQIVRAVIVPGGVAIDTLVIGLLCLAVAEVIRRQNAAAPDEEKEVAPNRPHPLERPQRARPSVPALPSDK